MKNTSQNALRKTVNSNAEKFENTSRHFFQIPQHIKIITKRMQPLRKSPN